MLKDKIDEKILEYLRNDSRESFVEIGKKLKLSESAVRRRVKNLVDSKVIERFTIEMGEMNSTSAIVLISVDSTTDTSKVSSRLTKLNAVKTVWLLFLCSGTAHRNSFLALATRSPIKNLAPPPRHIIPANHTPAYCQSGAPSSRKRLPSRIK